MAADPQRSSHGREPGPTLSRTVAAPPAAVWSALADGWSYPSWVVGTSRVRAVDADWPQVGSRIHHSVGLWPLLIDDYTRVEHAVAETELVLTARAWPAGEARVHFSLRPGPDDTAVVTLTEDAVSGPARFLPARLRQALLTPRNRETLHRLALLAEGRHQADPAV